MTDLTLKARVTLTRDGLNITDITGRPSTPGNVGVAFSGGGSRAASTALGVARALNHFGVLRHVRAISSVSGGSWFSVPFTFLPSYVDDELFLGPYVESPADLRLAEGDAPTCLRTLDEDNFGAPLTKFAISTAGILADALVDHREGVALSRLWTHEIGENLLAHFNLANFGDDGLPADTFCADASALGSIKMANPGFDRPCHLVRAGDYLPRPYLIVNGAMRVEGPGGEDVLAPVQFTPYFSGVMGESIGTLGGRPVGGGGISSFAFGGQWLEGSSSRPQVRVEAPLALSDITGISSAAYADALGDRDVDDFSPTLTYFSPTWEPPVGVDGVFADAGSVENTGVASLLSYEDIDGVIAVVSSPKPIEFDGDQVVVERQVNALFGFREYNSEDGYRRYSDPGEGNPDYADNQVFASDNGEFESLVAAMGALQRADNPIVVEQVLDVVRNDKFAVRGGRKVRVLWLFLSPSRRWTEQLHPLVRLALDMSFPNISTARTMLSETDVSLLAHFSGWMLAQNEGALERLFSAP